MSLSSDDLTKNEIIERIDALEAAIEEAEATPDATPDPGHDLYRSTMFGQCLSCDARYVDAEECAACRPMKAFLQRWRATYPWKSDQKGPPINEPVKEGAG